MRKAIHGKSIYRSNLCTDIRIAKESGFKGLEIVDSKLLNYVDAGLNLKELNSLFKENSILPVSVNDILSVERVQPSERKRLMEETERLVSFTEAIGCSTIQLVPLCGLQGKPWNEIRKLTASNIAQIADIGKVHGIRFQLETVAWSPINTLSKSLEVISEAGRDNVGIVVDFWHLWSGDGTSPEEVAKLNKSIIYCIHFCDGKRAKRDVEWEETKLRGYYPGEGDIPMSNWVEAVKATGYDGVWSCELVSSKHWEMDVSEVADTLSRKMDEYLKLGKRKDLI